MVTPVQVKLERAKKIRARASNINKKADALLRESKKYEESAAPFHAKALGYAKEIQKVSALVAAKIEQLDALVGDRVEASRLEATPQDH